MDQDLCYNRGGEDVAAGLQEDWPLDPEGNWAERSETFLLEVGL